MRILILLLVLAISTQPLQAGICDMDMEKGQESSHHTQESENNEHDCCDSDDSDSKDGCDGEMKCGFCFANVSALPDFIKANSTWVSHFSLDLSSGVILPIHSSPPFRPPIS
jgi:hypothetical protein